MRSRYNDLLCDRPLPIVYVLSAMGTNTRVCSANPVTTILTPRVAAPDRILDHTYLENGWNIDILSEEGFAKMKEIVNLVKTTPYNA
ncbi:hypothetical protein C8R46DRAFT_1297492 [Mycena filopes]|nr:hypothetical protein C8R46DRAFT_1297492 [Mycena filopes]